VIAEWLAPVRALAVAQLRANEAPAEPVSRAEQERQLVRSVIFPFPLASLTGKY
jgi:hypothetical protein